MLLWINGPFGGGKSATARGPVIVPMTLIEPAYFAEVIGGLAAAGMTSGTLRCWRTRG